MVAPPPIQPITRAGHVERLDRTHVYGSIPQLRGRKQSVTDDPAELAGVFGMRKFEQGTFRRERGQGDFRMEFPNWKCPVRTIALGVADGLAAPGLEAPRLSGQDWQ